MKRELVDAYLAGQITRGQFIKRMISFGVSMVAAGAFAQAVAADAEAGTRRRWRRIINQQQAQSNTLASQNTAANFNDINNVNATTVDVDVRKGG